MRHLQQGLSHLAPDIGIVVRKADDAVCIVRDKVAHVGANLGQFAVGLANDEPVAAFVRAAFRFR